MSSNVKDDEHEAKVNEVLEKVLKTNAKRPNEFRACKTC